MAKIIRNLLAPYKDEIISALKSGKLKNRWEFARVWGEKLKGKGFYQVDDWLEEQGYPNLGLGNRNSNNSYTDTQKDDDNIGTIISNLLQKTNDIFEKRIQRLELENKLMEFKLNELERKNQIAIKRLSESLIDELEIK